MLIQFKKGSGKRLLSLLLVLAMLLPNLTGIVSATESNVNTGGDISGYSVDVQIFNYMYRSGQLGSDDIPYSNEGVFPLSSATDFNYDITIGGIASDSSTRKPMTEHIKVELANLQAKKTMTINPVYPDAPTAYQTQLKVTAGSHIENLVLGENAQVTLDLKANLTIGTLTMGEGSQLTINIDSNNTLSLVGNATGDGTLQISGGKLTGRSIAVRDMSVDSTTAVVTESLYAKNELRLNGVGVDIEGGKITAGKSINAVDATINGAALFGFDSDATGEVSLAYANCIFNDVDLVGAAENCEAKVKFAEDCVVDVQNNVLYVRDYTINYQVDSDAIGTDWPRYYRVKFKNGENTVMPGEIVLPQYAAPGYTYMGWKTTADSETVIQSLTNQQGNLTLYPSTEAANIKVIIDLMFNLEQEACDNADAWKEEYNKEITHDGKTTHASEIEAILDSTITLDIPQRFGYVFQGWRLAGTETILKNVTSYQVIYSQLTDKVNNELRLEAVWEADKFPLYWVLDDIPLEFIEISVNGGEEWMTPAAFMDAHGNYWVWEDDTHKVMRSKQGAEIYYGESLTEYFARLNSDWKPFVLRDIRSGADKEMFQSWYHDNQKLSVYESSTFDMNPDTGILGSGKQADSTWNEYQEAYLKGTVIKLSSLFGSSSYDLTVDQTGGWSYQLNGGDIQSLSKGTLTITNGTKVTLIGSKDASFSNWAFESPIEINFTERYHGEDVVYYDFIMPACNVTATYQSSIGKKYIDIANGAITFEENVDVNNNGLLRDGFWHSARLNGGKSAIKQLDMVAMTPVAHDPQKGYFYVWNMSNALYVTSDGVATTNQLTLVKTATIYFNQCYLQAREAYTENFVDLCFDGRGSQDYLDDCASWGEAGNIIISREKNEKYAVNFVFEKTNTIAAIMPDQWRLGTNYEGTINLKAASSGHEELILGSVWDNSNVNGTNLNITAYSDKAPDKEKDQSDYLFLVYGGTTVINCTYTFTGCTINAPTKHIRTYFGHSKTSKCTVDLYSWYSYYQFNKMADTTMHLYGDFLLNVGMTIDNSNLVVDGNLYQTSHRAHNYTHTIQGGSKVIVRGNVAEFFNLTINGANTLLVANVIAAEKFTISNGTIVANMLTAPVYGSRTFTADGAVRVGAISLSSAYPKEKVYANEEAYPFRTRVTSEYVMHNAFSGGSIYLTGYYPKQGQKQQGANFYYDWNTYDAENPVGKFISDNNLIVDGKWNKAATLNDFSAMTGYTPAEDEIAECIVYGYSKYNTPTSMVTHTFSGTKLFAAGNITLFNDTTVSGGELHCGGTFSSKLDLTVTGGTIHAKEVGNSYNFTETAEDGNPRWQKTVISGGTIKADRIGALTKSQGAGTVESRSTLAIGSDAQINGAPTLVTDTSINFLFDDKIFAFASPIDNIRFEGTDFAALQATADIALPAPSLVGQNETGSWLLDSLSGELVDTVSKDAKFLANQAEITTVAAAYGQRDNISLYAVKANYNIRIEAGLEHVASISNTAVTESTVPARAGQEVTMVLKDATMADKIVIWYEDDTGKIFNTMPVVETVNGNTTVSFAMPYADVDVFIADTVTLYLDKNEINITQKGFDLEYSDAPENRSFTYAGNLVITDSRITSTTVYGTKTVYDQTNKETHTTENRVHISADTAERTVTFTKVIQLNMGKSYNIYLEDGVDVSLYVDGAVKLGIIYLPYNSTLVMEGVHKNTVDQKPGEAAYDDQIVISSAGNKAFIRNASGKLGTFTARHLQFWVEDISRPLIASADTKWSDKPVLLEDCKFINKLFYNTAEVFAYIDEVTLRDSYFRIEQASDVSDQFAIVKHLLLDSTDIYFSLGAGRYSYIPFYSVDLTELAGNSQFKIVHRHSTDSKEHYMYYRTMAKKVLVRENATLECDQRLALGELTVQDNGKVKVTGNGYLFCKDLLVKDQADVSAAYILGAGYYEHGHSTEKDKTPTSLQAELDADSSSIVNGASCDGIVVEGGTVTATHLIGGDKNGKLTISGGTVNAPKIGTYGALFGYPAYIPKSGSAEPWCYTSEKIPAGIAINISGGKVNVGEYLGGMNSTVNITGGEVNLAENAILGMTDAQMNTLSAHYKALGQNIADHKDKNISVNISGGAKVEGETGGINTPYGATNISGKETAVKLQDISAIYGDVTIRDTRETYSVPGVEKNVGVWVSDTLIGQKINILDDAQVFARFAYADAPQEDDVAELNVIGNLVTLHAEAYGSSGKGKVTITGEAGVNIKYTTRQYIITYMLNDDNVDPATNDGNPAEFIHSSEGKPVYLNAPVRHGYEFVGWYALSDDGTKVPLPVNGTNWYFLDSAQNDIVVYADWKPLEVQFKIKVDIGKHYVGTTEELTSMGGKISQEGQIVTFTDIVSVPYLEQIFGTGGNGINLDNFAFPSYSIVKLVYGDEELTAATATVTKEILHDYTTQANPAPLELWVSNVIKKNEHLVFALNVGANGRPVGAAFQNNISGNTISGSAAVGATLGSVKELLVDGQLNQPTAPGYTFVGWNTKADGTGEPVDANYVVGGGNATTFYAKWVPNTYAIKFDSAGGQVTKDNNPPDATAPQELTAYVTYDQKINGNISYTSGASEKKELPVAWKDGYHFKGWAIKDSNTTLTTQELNTSTFNKLDLSSTDEVLTFEAVYSPVVVTYHTEGGTFTSQWIETTDAQKVGNSWRIEAKEGVVGHGLPLAGYIDIRTVTEGEGNYNLSEKQQTVGEAIFAVLSTTATYFQKDNQNTYYPGDYRDDIGKKGYTFLGWNTKKDGSGEWIGTLPARTDIELYAQWAANSYRLQLNQGEYNEETQKAQSTYSELRSDTGLPENRQWVEVTVGKTIDGITDPTIGTNWSNRTQWYVTAKTELENAKADKRYILGFTFDWLEPGAPSNNVNDTTAAFAQAYRTYAASVTALINNQALMTKTELIAGTTAGYTDGSVFHLPSDDAYNNDKIAGVNVVPDYPNGSEIPMYAVYRERSLVFIERYVDASGVTHETVLHTAPVAVYSDYAESYINSAANRAVENLGYKLIRWAVNDPQGNTSYVDSKDNYDSLRDQWQKDANNKGSYDINVYTVYAPQVAESITLTASTQPSAESAPAKIYSIPGSMAFGEMQYSIVEKSKDLVIAANEAALERYNPAQTKAVAIFLEFIDPDGNVRDTQWLNATAGDTNVVIGGGWQIRMTLFHSRVISSEDTLQFAMNMTFPDQKEQSIALDVNVALQPTEWTVRYIANLPDEDLSRLQIIPNDFKTEAQDSRILTASDYHWIYGTALWSKDKAPEIEGYVRGDWTYNGETYPNGNLPLTSSDPINVSMTYTAKTFAFVNNAAEQCEVDKGNGKIPYHTAIKITPKVDPAFIWVQYGNESYRLDLLKDKGYPFFATEENGVYEILMPNGDVTLAYDDTMELYLCNGTIDVTAESYTQNGKTVMWPGNYRIWQAPGNIADLPTENVLNLSGDLTKRNDGSGENRTIELGKLNISTQNSIALAPGAQVVLQATGSIVAENILVPSVDTQKANLTLISRGEQPVAVTLTPAVDCAAIGGTQDSGAITLNNLMLEVDMPALTRASGIGPGVGVNAKGERIQIIDCNVTINEKDSSIGEGVKGTWIGSQETAEVELRGTIINDNGSIAQLTMLDAKTVRIDDCKIGDSAGNGRIENHIIRGDNIFIDNSEIYMISADYTVLRAGAAIAVDSNWNNGDDASIISVVGSHQNADWYYGTMQIYRPESSVDLWNNRFLELNNGDITITAEKVTQGEDAGVTHEHAGSYQLLNAFDSKAVSNLTINGISTGAYVAMEGDFTVGELKVNADAVLHLSAPKPKEGEEPQATVTFKTTDVAATKTLTVNAGDGVTLNTTISGNGNYVQKGGKLSSTTDDFVVGGNLTLENVTANVQGNIGSNGLAGVTMVSLKNSTVTAAKIGAIGEQSVLDANGNQKGTFTQVALDGDVVLTGNLVQDHYRLHYNITDENFALKNMYTSLRSSTVYTDGVQGVTTYIPAIPNEPDYIPTDSESYFSNWYILTAQEERIAVSNESVKGFETHIQLDAATIQHAEDTDPADGTKTLELYAWMKLNGEGTIINGRELNAVTFDEDALVKTVQINTHGAWTARFDVEGAALPGAKYQFTFDQALPIGTKLTLRFGKTNPVYYYHIVKAENVTMVKEDDFILMGSNDTADLILDSEELLEHTLQLSADFADVAAIGGSVALSVEAGTTSYPIDSVSYTVQNAVVAATCEVNGQNVSYSVIPNNDPRYNGKTIYLVAKLSQNGESTSVPYDAKITWNDSEGTWLGGDTAYFVLGNFTAMSDNAGWLLEGLDSGTYAITWYLTAAPAGTQNVFQDVLATSNAATFSVSEAAMPSLAVTLQSVNETTPDGYVLTGSESYVLVFSYETNMPEVQARLEKQTALKLYSEVDNSVAGTTVTIPAETGVYRVRFSLDGFGTTSSDWDDVYFSFVVR